MSSKLSDVLESRSKSATTNCQLGSSSSNPIGNCKKPSTKEVDSAVDYAIEQGVAVKKFPDGHNARAWYCKVVITLGVATFLQLVAQAKQEGEAPGSKLFSVLIAKRLKKHRT